MGKLLHNCFKILGKGWENFYTIAFKKQSTFFVDYENGSEMYKWYQVLAQGLMKENGWKSCMTNWKDWRSENVNLIELNCKVVKKVATPHFCINPPFSGLSPLSSKKFCTPLPPLSDSIFGRPFPLSNCYENVHI